MRPAPVTDDQPDNQPRIPLAPEGRWAAVFVDWYDDGIQEIHGQYVPCIKLIWQLECRRADGRRHLVSQRYHRTMSHHSKLRLMLERWQDARFTDLEVKWGVDLTTWWKRPCYITVKHCDWRPNLPWVQVAEVEPWDYREPRQPLQPEGISKMWHGAKKHHRKTPRTDH